MKADPRDQQLLLELQDLDTTLAQLAHRRATLPELAELAELTRTRSVLAEEQLRARDEADGLDREIARLERDVEQVRARRERDSARLAMGTGPARELTALQHEIESLDRRQRELEDAELELMERREQVQSTLDQVGTRTAEADQRRSDAEARQEAALAGIGQQEQAATGARAPLAAKLPEPLLALYERIRTEAGGVGAALLRAGRCGGCRLDLSGSERARLQAAPVDEVVRCEECRRILVRTAKSGL